jgi:hypothetical protein
VRRKAFCGTSQNAVRTPIWIAISVYLLAAILKQRLHPSLYAIGVFKTLAERGSHRRKEADSLNFPPVRLLTSAATSRF